MTEQVNNSFNSGFEYPAMFRKDSIYYFLGSLTTNWEGNDKTTTKQPPRSKPPGPSKVSSHKFLSPVLLKGTSSLIVSVTSEDGNWSDKKKNVNGNTGDFVILDKLIVK